MQQPDQNDPAGGVIPCWLYCAYGMDRLLGHLAQFGSFWQQGELLCTQGLAYLLRDAEGERVFTGLISLATGHSLSPGLSWQAERRQEDRGRPDLEGRNAEGQAVVKIEAKLGAPFGQGHWNPMYLRFAPADGVARSCCRAEVPARGDHRPRERRTSKSRAPGLGASCVRPSKYLARSLPGRACWRHFLRSPPSGSEMT